MKKNDEIKIKILSNIKDKFIDGPSSKRFKLINRKRMPKWIIPSSAAAILLIAVMIPVLLFMLQSPIAKQVPVYQGMTAHAYNGDSSANAGGMSISFLSAGGSDVRAYEWLDNDSGDDSSNNTHDQTESDTQNETETVTDGETSSIGVSAPDIVFYTHPNTDFYIKVHISNPDNFEILSFTLNGKKYSSYMFEPGSDMENLILKCNAGDAEGIVEYTIDAIKYVDGTEIKDVVMEGNRTIKIGVYSEKQPKASIENESAGLDNISLDVSLTDELELLKISNGKVRVDLKRGNETIAQREIKLGELNSIAFDSLELGAEYTYEIVAHYDALDGNGIVDHVLRSGKVTTHSPFAIKIKDIGQSDVGFDIEWNELVEEKALKSLEIYMGEEKVADIGTSLTAFEDLLSGAEYTLVAAYELRGKTFIASETFTTKAKALPEVVITANDITQTSFKFDVSVTDSDNVGAITKIELIHNGNAQNITDLGTREFTSLLSNNKYTVKVTYTYDLNDGVGTQTVEQSLPVTTLAKAEPTFTFKHMIRDEYSVSGSYAQTNTDNTLIGYSVKLYSNNEFIKENTDKKIEFDSLDYYTDYTIKIIYTFDLNDGKGVQEKTVEHTVKTMPYFAIESLTVRNSSAIFQGNTIYLQVNIDNPQNAKVTHAVVSGKKYAVASTSTSNIMLIEIPCDESLGGGEIVLKVEALYADIDNISYESKVDSDKSATVFVNGEFSITAVELVNDRYEAVDWCFKDDQLYVKLTVSNPSGYDITQVSIFASSVDISKTIDVYSENITKLSNSEYLIDHSLIPYGTVIQHTTVYYGNQHMSASIETELYSGPNSRAFFDERAKDTTYISTTEEFIAMLNGSGYGYYELTADIDLSGIGLTHGGALWGVLNGNGYAIKNLSIVGERQIGLFEGIYGMATDIRFENLFLMRDEDSNFGILSQNGFGGIIRNCVIDESSFISVTCINEGFGGDHMYYDVFGGLGGGSTDCEIRVPVSVSCNSTH